ncbi:argininosuccinate synthase [Tunicatimonas pelagia]|uniref:argininosuccinate synthase n=1 Tax=Tunicatimonas pelagia TaxID=931531 RepID=UPI00266505D5|nr:argininosuccinate synthase domain-containing protein [Tunicatimonas pelagia]WKN43114.1 argininosuccinate synthase [Tunicatimonas pelagia]
MSKNNQPIVVLAFSGGLDTSYCVVYLRQQGYRVHAVTVNTGGFSAKQLKDLERRAKELGAEKFEVLDETKRFYKKCLRYLIYGNVLRNHTYPLSVSAERVFQALAIVQYAQDSQAEYVAHGSTGAGNDQVRFDLAFRILSPKVQIITPIRDQQLSRQEEVEFLKENGIDWSWEKAKYSINQGIWGTSVGGQETLTSHQSLPEEAYPSQLLDIGSQKITLGFEKGEVESINGKSFKHPIELIQELQRMAAPYAIGRDTHVGDTIVGIKGRVGFEAAAPLIIIHAHQLLEKHTLTKWQLYWKDQLATWYGMMVHEGQFLDPVMRNIEVFLKDTQKLVSGEVYLQLHPYRYELQGISSANDLMSSKFGDYGEANKAWTGEDVKGFTNIAANATKIWFAVNRKKS